MCHGGKPHDALLHVPLIMDFPDVEISPATFDLRVDLRDVKPTLLDYLGIEDDSSTGRSLLPIIRGESNALPASRPYADLPERFAGTVIPGQDPAQTERLIEELRALGYID